MNASMDSCIHIIIYISLSIHIPFIRFYHDLSILVLSIFISCMLLLIRIFIYAYHSYTGTHSYALSSFVYLYCSYHLCLSTYVPIMFHLIPFGMSIIYSYHLRIPITSLSIHIFSIFLSCSIYSFMYDNHMLTSYKLIFICAYHSCTLDYHILRHVLSYLIVSYDLYLSYSCFLGHIYTYCIFYNFLVSLLLHIALHILIMYDV